MGNFKLNRNVFAEITEDANSMDQAEASESSEDSDFDPKPGTSKD